jgi:putative flippase GtrA
MGCVLSIAFLISFCFVGLLGYTLHSKISFCAPMSWAGLQRYLLAMSLNVPTAFGVTWLCKDFFVLPMAAAAPLASTFMLIFNFLLSRWAIVRPEKPA